MKRRLFGYYRIPFFVRHRSSLLTIERPCKCHNPPARARETTRLLEEFLLRSRIEPKVLNLQSFFDLFDFAVNLP
jgi:hypothetical protein